MSEHDTAENESEISACSNGAVSGHSFGVNDEIEIGHRTNKSANECIVEHDTSKSRVVNANQTGP